ncbi:MAG: hypothetical protein PWR13_270 [Archaeoglobi archaeon]|nr:hypothetical protein [Archaeoglobi archaeon]
MKLEILEGVAEIYDLESFLDFCRSFRAVVQPISAEVVISRRQIEFAVRKALESFEKGENIAKNLGMEILLYTLATRNISRALEYGVREGLNRLVIVILGENENVEEAVRKMKERIREEKVIGRSVEIEKLMKIFDITAEEIEAVGAEKIEELVIERIALFHVFK